MFGAKGRVEAMNQWSESMRTSGPLHEKTFGKLDACIEAYYQGAAGCVIDISTLLKYAHWFRQTRSGDPDASKHPTATGGAHFCEVLRKQIIALEAMGVMYCPPAIGEVLGKCGIKLNRYEHTDAKKVIFVGAGDKNITYVDGIKARFVDKVTAKQYDILCEDFDSIDLKEHVDSRFFSDAMASVGFIQNVVLKSANSGGAIGSVPVTEFKRSWYFAERLAVAEVHEFCVKIVVDEDPCEKFTTFLKHYDVEFFPGGRGHNMEMFLRCIRREDGDNGMDVNKWSKFVSRLLQHSLYVSLLRFRAETTMYFEAYKTWVRPGKITPGEPNSLYGAEKGVMGKLMDQVVHVSGGLTGVVLADEDEVADDGEEAPQVVDPVSGMGASVELGPSDGEEPVY